MKTMDDAFRNELLQHPQDNYDVIVRTNGEATSVAEHCTRQGMTIHHHYRLLPGLALTATGEALLALANHPAVARIERDSIVTV